jgi:hypothetical protein
MLVIAGGHGLLQAPHKTDTDLGDGIALELILNKGRMDLQVYHLHGAADGAAQYLRVTQILQVRVAGRQLDELSQWIRVENERELVAARAPTRYGRCDACKLRMSAVSLCASPLKAPR